VDAEEPVFENVVLLETEEQLANCDRGTGPGRNIGICPSTGFDHIVSITDSPPLATQPSFEAGEVYYFTSKCQ